MLSNKLNKEQKIIFETIMELIEDWDKVEGYTAKEKMSGLIFTLLTNRDGEGFVFHDKGVEILLDYRVFKGFDEDKKEPIWEYGSWGDHETWYD